MATNPFEFLSRTKVSRETVLGLGAEEEEEEIQSPENPFDLLSQIPKTGIVLGFQEQVPSKSGRSAFISGVGKGLIDPFRILTPGKLEEDEELTGPQKTAEMLGSFVGLGISFIPFSVGTGIAMRGFGLTKALSPQIAQAIRFTSAGGLQFAGSSEDLSEVPKNLAVGIAFGGAIELAFLSRAMGARVGKSGDEILDVIRAENEIVPTQGKPAERIVEELRGISQENITNEMILTDLTKDHVESMILQGIDNTKIEGLRSQFLARSPDGSFHIRPKIKGQTSDILLHTPVNPVDRLTSTQLTQWNERGFFEGMEAIYRGESYKIAGMEAVPGRIQIQSLSRPGHVFAPKIEEVTLPLSPRVFSESTMRRGKLQTALNSLEKRIGFAIATATGRVQRGFVDVEKYATASSFDDWIKQNWNDIKSLPGQFNSVEEAAMENARRRGIEGLIIKEEGVITDVRIFDNNTISYLKEPPRAPGYGVEIDKHSMYINPDGTSSLISFTPGWKTSVGTALREAGVAQKEINEILEMHASSMGRRLENVMDDEYKTMIESSRAQFTGGCQ